jgi:hypothetical protein
MKAVFLLLICFGLFPVFSAAHSFSALTTTVDGSEDEVYTKKEVTKYYKNGNLKRRRTVFYTADGKEYQTIYEKFRRSGAKRNCWVMNTRNIIQLTRYNREGHLKFERNYYYSGPFLQSVETRRANGKVRVQYQPGPEPATRCVHYETAHRSQLLLN